MEDTGTVVASTPEEVLREARSVADAVIEQAERRSMGELPSAATA